MRLERCGVGVAVSGNNDLKNPGGIVARIVGSPAGPECSDTIVKFNRDTAADRDDHTLATSHGLLTTLEVVHNVGRYLCDTIGRTDDFFEPSEVALATFDGCVVTLSQFLGENIHLIDECTSCRKDYLWSHRAESGFAGRMMAVIGIT